MQTQWLLLLQITVILTYSHVISATQSSKPTKKPPQKTQQAKGPQNYSVFDRNLVSEKVTAQDVLANHRAFFRETDEYLFENGMVLGYVTPWNNHGYDVAKIFGNKFTHISPVWYQVVRTGKKEYEIEGQHDVDRKWVAKVLNAGRERKVKIVPRVVFERWTGKDFSALFASHDEMDELIKTLILGCNAYQFDGLVIEVWSLLAGAVPFDPLVNFVKRIAYNMKMQNLEVIITIPPKRNMDGDDLFTDKHFDALYDDVTAFSLMTYDFSSPNTPGPNSPIQWMEDCVKSLTMDSKKRRKILTGLNFYGNDYAGKKGSSLIGGDYVKKLNKFKGKFVYDQQTAEHVFTYKDAEGVKHTVYYPTLYSVNRRIKLAEELGTGLSIWEIGQGLDYFYDLL